MIKDLILNTKLRTAAIQKMLYAAILDYMVSSLFIKDDKILFNNSNINAVNKIDKIISKDLEKPLTGIKNYILSGIRALLGLSTIEFSKIDIRAMETSGKVQDKILKHAIRNLDQITDLTPIFAEVKRQAIGLMSNYDGISLQELRNKLNETITDKKLVERYWSRWTYDIYSQYERIGANEIRKELDLVFAVYEGGEIETTRDFCRERMFQVFHESEIEDFKNLDWEGKNEIGYNPIIDMGGYNCRHQWRWVSAEFAEMQRPEVKQLFPAAFN